LNRRIFGTECEYAPVIHRRCEGPSQRPRADTLAERQKHIAEKLIAGAALLGIPMAGEFLGNGGRLYADRGGHPEYATPECCTVADLVTHEIAGDRLVQELAQALRAQEGFSGLHVYKNNVDYFGRTYGGHENYLISARGYDQIGRLLPFIATRQIYTGAGKVMTTARDGACGFQISQRADFFDHAYSDRTSGVRGMINIRKREIARAGQSRRLHLIVGDSNMAPFALGLKIATAVLMLNLLEAGVLDSDFDLLAPVQALKAVSRDLQAPIRARRHGRWSDYTALEIQSIYLDMALRFFAAHPPGGEEAQWLRMWERILCGMKELTIRQSETALEQDGADLKRKIDWILKLWLLDRGRAGGANEQQLKKMDLKYHDLDPAGGLYERCASLDLVDRIVSESDLARARGNPPDGTRAYLRGAVIQRAFRKKVDVQVENWERIRIRARNAEAGVQHCFKRVKSDVNSIGIDMTDPFRADDPQAMQALCAFMEKWG
jgi:proteasome accessory factor A